MLNSVSIGGRPTAEPQLHVTKSGAPYVTFRLANPRGSMKSNFITVECWGKLVATTSERVRKGVVVLVTGELYHREWRDSDGTRHERLTVRASAIYSFDRSVVPDEICEILGQPPDDIAA